MLPSSQSELRLFTVPIDRYELLGLSTNQAAAQTGRTGGPDRLRFAPACSHSLRTDLTAHAEPDTKPSLAVRLCLPSRGSPSHENAAKALLEKLCQHLPLHQRLGGRDERIREVR
ncbi:unnamed protein product [Protopolystoma xenopodis]|uniref:Uncharacterized protein n=1 Tax=Protopolystoma xenopodis TaxID=117903 RepID=A0A3S5CSY3_9PLAT|nr:unnamed protein product [Protopolystoma xenopodis]